MPLDDKRHKKPFSNKQKKEQLQAKRERKRNRTNDSTSSSDSEKDEEKSKPSTSNETNTLSLPATTTSKYTRAINQQPIKSAQPKSQDPNRFNLHFARESQEELKRLKKNASKELKKKDEKDLEIDFDEVYKPDSPLDMPIRPKWKYEMTKEQVENQEKTYFNNYLRKIFENYKQEELSYFEMNLETWRQLWRVLEISDIILLIVDIRFAALHFSPAFYNYCNDVLKKDVILVLNKIDLVQTSTVIAWKHYFLKRFPNLHILLFSSSKQIKRRTNKPKKDDTKTGEPQSQKEIDEEQLIIKALAADIYTAKAHLQLYECVKNIVKNKVDLTSWAQLTEKLVKNQNNHSKSQVESLSQEDTHIMEKLLNNEVQRNRFEHGFVTIGCCGFPNVGKSSLLNSLNGRKVVSVSKTPGHTKHLQTIFLTKTVRLCDCPGLVFPSLVSKPLQILAGMYPIAQLQEPYSAIRYMAERIPIISILKIKHPNEETSRQEAKDNKWSNSENEWSPLDICEGWAIKRGYFTAKACRPDVYRAANEILRMALDGRLCLSLRPKNFYLEKDYWFEHNETKELNDIVHNVELTAKQNKHLYDEGQQNAIDENESNDSESESDAYQYGREFESVDDKEKKDETNSDSNDSKLFAPHKNPYSLLNINDE